MFPQVIFLDFLATLAPIVPIICVIPNHGTPGFWQDMFLKWCFWLLLLLHFHLNLILMCQLESASSHSCLHSHQCLHATHCHLRLLPHIVSPHKSLQPHQPLQGAQCSTSLQQFWHPTANIINCLSLAALSNFKLNKRRITFTLTRKKCKWLKGNESMILMSVMRMT